MTVYNIGINDLHERTAGRYYKVWQDMLHRCYATKRNVRDVAYTQCTVDPDWLFFSVFREWMQTQPWEERELDKDILHPGCKQYAPDTCCFVTQHTNKLLNSRKAARGNYPQGVWRKGDNSFATAISINGKRKHIGYFSTPEEAHRAYCAAKAGYILDVAEREHGTPDDAHIHRALVRIAATFSATPF